MIVIFFTLYNYKEKVGNWFKVFAAASGSSLDITFHPFVNSPCNFNFQDAKKFTRPKVNKNFTKDLYRTKHLQFTVNIIYYVISDLYEKVAAALGSEN